MDQVPFRCGGPSCGGSSAITPVSVQSSAFATRLTPDTLQQHEDLVRKSPARVPNFSGDKLAKTSYNKKTKLQLAKERREKAQQELERFAHEPNTRIPSSPPRTEDIKQKHWIEMERQKVLAAKWQRKKQEQRESMRAEQLRQAELERQRKLLEAPSTPIKKRPTRGASPLTPRIHHIATRKLIHI